MKHHKEHGSKRAEIFRFAAAWIVGGALPAIAQCSRAQLNQVVTASCAEAKLLWVDIALTPSLLLDLHKDSGGTFPMIEFYEGRFKRVPAAQDLSGRGVARDYGADGSAHSLLQPAL